MPENALAIGLPPVARQVLLQLTMLGHTGEEGFEDSRELARFLPRLHLLGECKLQSMHNLPQCQVGVTTLSQHCTSSRSLFALERGCTYLSLSPTKYFPFPAWLPLSTRSK